MYLKANAAAIWKRRKELGMTQLQVDQKAGIGSMSLTRMENEKHLVHPFRAKAVADALECQVYDLFEEVHKPVS